MQDSKGKNSGPRGHSAVPAWRVVIADLSPMARAGLTSLLADDTRFDVVAAVGDCETVLPWLAELSPDLLIVNPGRGDLTAIAALRSAASGALLLILSAEDDIVGEAVRAGADGFLLKDADGSEILAAIDRLMHGEAVLEPALAIQALRADGDAIGEPESLTPRELEVLRLLSHGQTNPQIAKRLFMAVGTVKVHVEHILSKLGAKNRTDAAVRGSARGLLDDELPAADRHMPAG
jgi:DNA-binding NarL/FixJ family response regulator